MDIADIVQVASRLVGEHDLALYLGIEDDLLRRYGAGTAKVPQLIALRIVDRLISESPEPSLALEAMADVLRDLKTVPP